LGRCSHRYKYRYRQPVCNFQFAKKTVRVLCWDNLLLAEV
jgi:hypothetical protein